MTPEDRRPDPEHDDELADAFDIDDAAQPRAVDTEPGPSMNPAGEAPPWPDASSTGADGRFAPAGETGPPAAAAVPAGAGAGAPPGPTPPTTPAATPAAATWRERRRVRRAEKEARRRKAPWWELPALVALAILIAILVKTFVVQPFYIPSGSMERTLHGCPGCSGDRILVNKPIYDLRDPHPGDIVVFDAPKDWNDLGETVPHPPSNPILRLVRGFGQLIGFVPPDDLVLVKRVIAVGGQTVKGELGPDGKDVVMVSNNGPGGPWRTLNEPFVYEDGPDDRADFGPVTVPKGRLWVMGDHRNSSADSRYHCGPNGDSDSSSLGSCDPVTSTVPISDVIGKAFVIAWPPSRWRTLGTPSTFEHAAAAGAVPLGVVLPLFGIRRRRRRRRR